MHPVNVRASLIGLNKHSLRPADNTSCLTFKYIYEYVHEESGGLVQNIKFSLFVKKPTTFHLNTRDRTNVELVFVRHNLEADLMFATCWMTHKSMVEEIIESNVDELSGIWLAA
jgi:hypothetical protein